MKGQRFISKGDGNFGDKNNNEENKVIRRTITVDDFVNQAINEMRAGLLKKNMELDFTTAINMLAEFGLSHLRHATISNPTDSDALILQKYLFASDELKMAATADQWQDVFLKKQWPKLVAQLVGEATKGVSS